MAKSKRKRRQELRDKKEGKRILTIVLISTFVLIILLYLVYANS